MKSSARTPGALSELLAEANDAGYSTDDATAALLKVVNNRMVISDHDPDPENDPAALADMNSDPHPLGWRDG